MASSNLSITRHRSEFLHNKPHLTKLIVREGGEHVFYSGLVASTPEGELVDAGDLAAQMKFILDSIGKALATVEAKPANIVRQRVSAVDLQLGHRPIMAQAMTEFYGESWSSAYTCVGVPAPLVEGALGEIDVSVVIWEKLGPIENKLVFGISYANDCKVLR